MSITLEEALNRVTSSGMKAAKHERHTEIIRAVCNAGSHVRQGDVVLEFLADADGSHEAGLKETNERQLAPGQTKGSRHVLEGDAKVYLRPDHSREGTTGPLIVTGEASPTVTHPEHRAYTLPTNTVWGVRYELDEATKERVRD